MKRVFSGIFILLLVFIGLLYWSLSSTSKKFSTCNLITINAETVDFKKHDSVLLNASNLYLANDLKRIMQGEQYRQAWSAEIKVPIVFLDTLFGGMNIIKEGGGKQTQSLKLESADGILYTLRSINKNPRALIPEFAKTLGLENILIDGISAQHPYGAILAAELSDAVNVIHTHPKVVFIPKQERLSNYNAKYGNRLFLLEYETEGTTNWTALENIEELIDTDDLQELKQKYPSRVSIDTPSLIRARLYDLIIGDWDRHTKQWGWALQKNDSLYRAFPISGDRDNAFFNTEGIIPTILSNKNIIPELRPFKEEINFMPGLVYPFDRYFLINTDEQLFISEAKKIQNLLTDQVLNDALNVWPESIINLDGNTIIRKIKQRRDDLVLYALEFKKEIDKKGLVIESLKGSEDEELNKKLMHCFECYNNQ